MDGADAPDSAVVYIDADLTNESSVKKALAQTIKAFGGIDGLVNVPPPPPESHSQTNAVLHDLNLESYQVYQSSSSRRRVSHQQKLGG